MTASAAHGWPSPARILGYTVFLLAVTAVFLMFMIWQEERQDRKFAAEQRVEVARGISMTTRGCPAVRGKIREIGANGDYSRREIEVLASLITSEQAKPGGLATCRAPEWQWFWGGWIVSKDYVS